MKQNDIFYQKLYFILYTFYLVHTTMHWLLSGELFPGKLISERSCHMYRYRPKNGVVFHTLILSFYRMFNIKVKELNVLLTP